MQTTRLIFVSALLNLVVISGTVLFYAQRGQTVVALEDSLAKEASISASAQADLTAPTEAPTPVVSQATGQNAQVAPKANDQQKKADPAPTAAPKQKPSGGCLVKLYDGVYDLAEFRKVHSGGDIFQCNTDMTSIFAGTHSKSYLNQLTKYRVQ